MAAQKVWGIFLRVILKSFTVVITNFDIHCSY